MSTQKEAIVPGFGMRLREERKRLGLNQEEFASLAGIQRLAQSQYEAETREPRLSYLKAIGAGGVDLYYVMFGNRVGESTLLPSDRRRIETHVFELIEDYAKQQCNGALSAEGRYVLFEVMRAHLTRVVQSGGDINLDVSAFLPIGGGANG